MDGFDSLWPGGPRFRQAGEGFPLSTDSVLLAHFASGLRAGSIIDLGCGAGVLTVLLSAYYPGVRVEGLEIQPAAAELCRENMRENGFDAEGIINMDMRLCKESLRAGGYDMVVSNPPYFPVKSGYLAPEETRAIARDERFCTLAQLCETAAYLCRWGGSFLLVHRPERLSEIFCAMTANGLEPKRLRLVQYSSEKAPNLALVEARRGGKPGLRIEPPLILTENGADTPEIRKIYHRG